MGTTGVDHPLYTLVPLDDSPLSEAALLPAAQLVTALTEATPGVVQLLRVVDVQPSYGKFRSSVDTFYDVQVRAEVSGKMSST